MRTLIFVAIAVLMAPVANAEACSNTDPNAKQYDTPFGTYYVVVDDCPNVETGCLFSVWIYEESNNIPGLQRGDEVYPPGPNPCPADVDDF